MKIIRNSDKKLVMVSIILDAKKTKIIKEYGRERNVQ